MDEHAEKIKARPPKAWVKTNLTKRKEREEEKEARLKKKEEEKNAAMTRVQLSP